MKTIRARILFVLSIASLVPLIAMFFVVGFFTRSALQNSEEAKITETGRELSQHVTVIMDGAKNDLESLKTNPILLDSTSSAAEKIVEMRRLVAAYDSYTDLSLYNPEGYLIDSTTEAVPTWREYTDWFKEAVEKQENRISHPGKVLGKPGLHLTVYLPLVRGNEVDGVVVARLSFSRVSDMIRNVKLGEEGFVYLTDQMANLIIDGRNPDATEGEIKKSNLNQFLTQPLGNHVTKDGTEYLYSAQLLAKNETGVDQAWTLIAFKPMSEVSAIANNTQLLLLASLAGSILVVCLIGFKFAGVLSKPLAEASEAAKKVAAGNLNARIPSNQHDTVELQNLTHSFNLMVEEVSTNRSQLEKAVTERTQDLKLSQEELERSASQLRAAFNATQEGILVSGEDGSIITINGRFYTSLGLDGNTIIKTPNDLRAQLELALDDASVTTEQALSELLRNHHGIIEEEWHLNGNRVIALYSAPIYSSAGEILGRISVIDDLSDKRNLEESMRQAQKMEAVGQMAGGVAHDFNNVLTGIIGNLSLVEMDIEGDEFANTRAHLALAKQAGDRAADLVKKLLGFSRRSHMNLAACIVNDVVTEAHGIVKPSLNPSIELIVEAEPKLWGIVADDTLLSQVLLNLCMNAKDAMPDGGELTITTSNQTVSQKYVRNHSDARRGEHVRITIEDTGTGIAKEVLEHVFEPFFTTKEQGKGTGLGLATSFGIVKQLGGWITINSEVGRGTRFEIFIPRSITAENQPSPAESIEIVPTKKSENETILLVDDEFIVRKVAETILTKLGYEVVIATNGEEALQVYKQREAEIDMVMLDLTMPTLSGKETFKLLRQKFDYIPVMICSGYFLDVTEFEEQTGSRPDGFVQKPYNFETMAKTLREVLDSPRIAA